MASELLTTNSVQDVAIIGYSHGGGITDNLAQRLIDDRQLGQVWGIRYTAYIDGIQRGPIDDWYPAFAETSRPNTERHDSFYNDAPFNLFSNPLKGDAVAGANNYAFPDETHASIDDEVTIHNMVENQIYVRVRA